MGGNALWRRRADDRFRAVYEGRRFASGAHPAAFTRTTEMDLTETEGRGRWRRSSSYRAEGIEAALLAVPYPADEAKQRMMNSAQAIADQYGVPFTTCLTEARGWILRWIATTRLPTQPGRRGKVSAYLSERLAADFDLPDHRQDAAFSAWDDAVSAYRQALKTR
ncbi:MAG: hypothetical protein ACLS7Z_03410 [Christensenellales bacterium]